MHSRSHTRIAASLMVAGLLSSQIGIAAVAAPDNYASDTGTSTVEQQLRAAYRLSRSFAPGDVRKVKAIESLAHLYEVQGRYASAEDMFNEALTTREKMYGVKNSPQLVKALYNLGRVTLASGDYSRSRQYLNRALDLQQKYSGVNDRTLASILFQQGLIDSQWGNFEQAEKKFDRALGIRQTNADHEKIALILSQKALAQAARGEIKDADNSISTALALVGRFVAADDPSRAVVLDAASRVRLIQGAVLEAEQMSNNAWRLRREAFGEQHPLTADTLLTSGLIQLYRGKNLRAENCFRRALEVFKHMRNRSHKSHADACLGLSLARVRQNKLKQARSSLSAGLEVLAANLGEDNEILSTYRDMYIQQMGVNLNSFEVMAERLRVGHVVSSEKFDLFGFFLSRALPDSGPAAGLLACTWKETCAVIGVVFVILILLSISVLVPGTFAMMLSSIWPGRKSDNVSSCESGAVEPEKAGCVSVYDPANANRPHPNQFVETVTDIDAVVPNAAADIQVWRTRLDELGEQSFAPSTVKQEEPVELPWYAQPGVEHSSFGAGNRD